MHYLRTRYILILIVFLPTLLFSCAVQPKDITASLEVVYPKTSEFHVGAPVDIIINNTSNYCVVFSLKDGLTIYAEQSSGQVGIANLVEFIGSQDWVIKPKGDLYSSRLISMYPDLSNLSITSPTKFYAKLTGHFCDDESVQVKKEIPFTIVP